MDSNAIHELRHDKTNKTPSEDSDQPGNLPSLIRVFAVWASAQSDQSLHCPHEEALGPKLPIECTAKTQISLGMHSEDSDQPGRI